MTRSPGGPFALPFPPWPFSRILEPVSTPGGTLISTFLRRALPHCRDTSDTARSEPAPSEAHRARAIDRKAALTERDHPAAIALRTRLELSTGSRPAPMTGCALLVDLELDGDLSAPGCRPERDVEVCFDCLALLRPARARCLTRLTTAEHRAEEIAEAAEPADVELLEVDVLRPAEHRRRAIVWRRLQIPRILRRRTRRDGASRRTAFVLPDR